MVEALPQISALDISSCRVEHNMLPLTTQILSSLSFRIHRHGMGIPMSFMEIYKAVVVHVTT